MVEAEIDEGVVGPPRRVADVREGVADILQADARLPGQRIRQSIDLPSNQHELHCGQRAHKLQHLAMERD